MATTQIPADELLTPELAEQATALVKLRTKAEDVKSHTRDLQQAVNQAKAKDAEVLQQAVRDGKEDLTKSVTHAAEDKATKELDVGLQVERAVARELATAESAFEQAMRDSSADLEAIAERLATEAADEYTALVSKVAAARKVYMGRLGTWSRAIRAADEQRHRVRTATEGWTSNYSHDPDLWTPDTRSEIYTSDTAALPRDTSHLPEMLEADARRHIRPEPRQQQHDDVLPAESLAKQTRGSGIALL